MLNDLFKQSFPPSVCWGAENGAGGSGAAADASRRRPGARPPQTDRHHPDHSKLLMQQLPLEPRLSWGLPLCWRSCLAHDGDSPAWGSILLATGFHST